MRCHPETKSKVRPKKNTPVSAYEISKSTGFHVDFGFQSGFLDFTWISGFHVDFWILKWISTFQSGFWVLFSYPEDTAHEQ